MEAEPARHAGDDGPPAGEVGDVVGAPAHGRQATGRRCPVVRPSRLRRHQNTHAASATPAAIPSDEMPRAVVDLGGVPRDGGVAVRRIVDARSAGVHDDPESVATFLEQPDERPPDAVALGLDVDALVGDLDPALVLLPVPSAARDVAIVLDDVGVDRQRRALGVDALGHRDDPRVADRVEGAGGGGDGCHGAAEREQQRREIPERVGKSHCPTFPHPLRGLPRRQGKPTSGRGKFPVPGRSKPCRRGKPSRGRAQKAASSSSMIEASTSSAIARSPASCGRTLRAKNDAAATLPS